MDEPQTALPHRIAGQAIVIVVVLIVLLLFTSFAIFAVRQNELAKSDRLIEVRKQFNGALIELRNTTKDILVAEEWKLPEQFISQGTCIRGGIILTYGTDRPYQEVLADYNAVFIGIKKWKSSGNVYIRSGITGYLTDTAEVTIESVPTNKRNLQINAAFYPIVYYVTLTWGDPEYLSCLPG